MSEAWFDSARSPYFVLFAFGFLPTIGWKLGSAFIAHGIDEDSELFRFINSVASALLAGIAARFLLQPQGALAHAPPLARIGALVIGLAAFAVTRRSVFAGVLAGEAAIMVLTFAASH
ncbi:MAG: AzlD domain-containing protein [Hyphomicrobiales bacterium]|nr:AzlD domain-containing protein [Hyphomicrobiales bacterium]